MSELMKVGWAEVDLTPNRKVSLAGQFAPRVSEYVESPVTVTALAVEVGGERMVLCSCDLAAVSPLLLSDVRSCLKGKVEGLDVEKIIVCATHTHTSIAYNRMATTNLGLSVLERYLPKEMVSAGKKEKNDDVMSEDEANGYLVERIAAAVEQAWNGRNSASFANAFGRAVVGHCRRVVYSDGSARMWGDTNQAIFKELEGGNDSGLELLYFFDEKSNPTGVVVNVACPAQCVQHRRFLSSDFWGDVKTLLRERFGDDFKVLGLCGAAGDQCPVDMIRWVEPESPLDDPNISRDRVVERVADPSMFDVAGKRKTGTRIAREVIAVFEEDVKERIDDPVFVHDVATMNLPVRRVGLAEYERAVAEIERFAKELKGEPDFNDNARMHVHAGTIARFEYQRDHDLYSVETHVIRLGNIAIATNPFELFLDYGNQIKARSLAAQTFLVQLACGCEGYLPTEKAERGGHYSAYVSSGITGHVGGEMLVRGTLERVNRLWQGE